MTTLGKLIRTTAFKLSAIYLVVFALFALLLLGYVAYNTRALLTRQLVTVVETEAKSLVDDYERGGIRQLIESVDQRSRRPGANLLMVTDSQGRGIVGNIAGLPTGTLDQDGWLEVAYERTITGKDGQATRERHEAIVRAIMLPSGFRLIVGRDVGEQETFRGIIRSGFMFAFSLIVLVALIGGVIVARRVMRRIDAVSQSSRAIMAGNLSERIPVTGSGDEFDRLADSLNAMLERIETLMQGLKDVSDNIAHDLKTPLTRLRNRAEDALRANPDEEGYREALATTIEESDQLIRTFNALLMIARVEAGAPRAAFSDVDLTAIVADVAELYDPVAEDAGVTLSFTPGPPVRTRANRELISQTLANLIDNALKYAANDDMVHGETAARPEDQSPHITLSVINQEGLIQLSVADNGPGIPEEARQRVLERFVRLDKSRSQPGSGLGLSLVNAVAGLHGGQINLDDNKPGLIVTLELPVREWEDGEHGGDTDGHSQH